MPRRTDLRKIIVIGSGPIVIGQACEFDYSGTQACTVLRRQGGEPAGLGRIAGRSLATSPVHEALIEESIAGWKEFELEVMRDGADNAVIVCSIENVDPMGVHTGDSITVAPQQTLSDREYQSMRDAAIEVLRVIGVETGGSNVQFAVD